ncbi:AbiJ-NTD4 domain-containing protein [Bradyrhizobium sp. 6(2017)]|uniref:AbiJ-NTD4 domain-containing protein n=1 Tax=Bradyrhizobium sp. 6(2017) TaxID=1197460 RepID=UPI002FE54D52
MHPGLVAEMADDLAKRKTLTFEQAEGLAPLPQQLQLREVSQELWNKVYNDLKESTDSTDYGTPYLDTPWSTILRDEHVYRKHRMVDGFVNNAKVLVQQTRQTFEAGNYADVFGWLEFVIRHPSCPHKFAESIENILRNCRAAYRVVDRTVICPIGSDTEHATIEKSFADLAATQFNGARKHLRDAASQLTAGNYADSVRESIHAVEAVARTLEPSANVLSKALARLEQKISIHPAMKKGFESLYAYTSDEGGIRHALLDDAANVDETDALFMFGSCAAFVSYLLNKARSNGLIN